MKYVLLLYLSGCSGWAFGVIGSDQTSNQKKLVQDNHCTVDEQCQDGYICIKTQDNYVGLCGRVVNFDDKIKEAGN